MKVQTKRMVMLLLACVAIVLAALACVPRSSAQAYSGQSGNMGRAQLHTQTLATSVRNDTPAITVFMHGLDGGAKDWSNDFNGEKGSGKNFVKDPDSLIEKMRSTANSGINLYRAQIFSSSGFTLYTEYGNESYNIVNTITNFSKHTIIVIDMPLTSSNPMEELYARLHYIIDKISYDYYIAKGNLPRINLIGHSMGGLLNMQYAIEHPKNVASLVSLGTPYNGSWYDNWLVETIGITDFQDQKCICGTCVHDYYFCNLETRRNTWNNVYAQNTHIGFYALSGETSASIVDHNVLTGNYFEKYIDMDPWLAASIRASFLYAPYLFLGGGVLPGDVCVDTDSQKAVGYNGAINYNKTFTIFNCNVDKRSQDHFPVPHNLEAYDKDMHSVILRVIDYGNNPQYPRYTNNGITAGIIAKSEGKWVLKITNNSGSARSFEYNQKMCFEGDAKSWSGLGHIASTGILANGASTIIEIEEYGTATSITVSYDSGSTRYIFYAYDLDASTNTMTLRGSTTSYRSYIENNIKIGIISKYKGKWTIKLTNNTGSARSFYYNRFMCFEGDARDWKGLSNIASTVKLKNNESTVIEISEIGTATSIAVSYINNSIRYIFYADYLNVSGTMISRQSTAPYYSYTKHGMKVSIIGKTNDASSYDTIWMLELTNNTGSTRNFEFNAKMCNFGDAQNWTGLSDIAQIRNVKNGNTIYIGISENAFATSIAISYFSNSTRYVFYANELDASGSMTVYENSKPYYTYTKNGMKVGIVGKNGNKWLIELTNNTGSSRTFDYNSKMCFEGDAKNWTGLSDVKPVVLSNGETTTTPIEITENGTATSIAISYTEGNYRYVFYAYHLDTAGTMTAMANTIDTTAPPESGCVAEGTLITLADGRSVPVETLTGNEMLLVWNLNTGTFDSAPVLFVDTEPMGHYEAIKLSFSNGTSVDVISEHGFWDVDLNKYVYLDKNASRYIGHKFMMKNGNGMTATTLSSVEISTVVTTVYSPVTYGHLCYFVNGMLSMPGGIEGLFNIFEADGETMTYDAEAMAADIEEYGLFTYEEFSDIYPIPEEIFEAFNGRYLKVAVGKGLITYEQIGKLIERYSPFF